MDIQKRLSNKWVTANALRSDDFEKLYQAASDPLIWEQHPNPDRWKREVFKNFFQHALESRGAYIVEDANTNLVIGSSRFYDFNEIESKIYIGYTFFRRSHWGGLYNYSLKSLMLDLAFQSVDKVLFHIGSQNYRSQTSIERLGAVKVRELLVAYAGEPERLNFEYEIRKENWETILFDG